MPSETSVPVIFRQMISLKVYSEKIKKDEYLMRESRQHGAISVSYWNRKQEFKHIRYIYSKQPPRSETVYGTIEGEVISPQDEYKWVSVEDEVHANTLLQSDDIIKFDLSLKSGDAFNALIAIVSMRMGDRELVKPTIDEATENESYDGYCEPENLLGPSGP